MIGFSPFYGNPLTAVRSSTIHSQNKHEENNSKAHHSQVAQKQRLEENLKIGQNNNKNGDESFQNTMHVRLQQGSINNVGKKRTELDFYT